MLPTKRLLLNELLVTGVRHSSTLIHDRPSYMCSKCESWPMLAGMMPVKLLPPNGLQQHRQPKSVDLFSKPTAVCVGSQDIQLDDLEIRTHNAVPSIEARIANQPVGVVPPVGSIGRLVQLHQRLLYHATYNQSGHLQLAVSYRFALAHTLIGWRACRLDRHSDAMCCDQHQRSYDQHGNR
jgi:hypothetical protein